MNEILLLIEAQGARRLPNFQILLNDQRYEFCQQILHTNGFCRQLECKIVDVILKPKNRLCVIMNDKEDIDNIDPATGQYVDHCIMIKQVRIEDIDADAVLYKQSYVEHSMPVEWIKEMQQKGHDILPKYPGSDLHLNGCMTFNFSVPFWLEKTIFLDSTFPKKFSVSKANITELNY